jgi:protein-S-isoprenylcysteine O-methyltransferase Ste14
MGILALIYGVFSYAIAMASLVYGIGFIANILVPKAIDTPPVGSVPEAMLVNLLLLGVFGAQHSVMARPGFKEVWTRLVPRTVERSTYVLLSGLLLSLVYWQWQPIAGTVWSVDNPVGRIALYSLYGLGWVILVSSTFMINHFDLFGLRQVYLRLKNAPYTPLPFVQVALYKFVRHPIMLGFLVVLWSTPLMSAGHMLFAAASTGYIFIGIFLEEHDLRRTIGEPYEQYRLKASMILPLPRRKSDDLPVETPAGQTRTS